MPQESVQPSQHPDLPHWQARRGLLPVLGGILFFFICAFLFMRLVGPISVNSITSTKSDLFTVDGVGEVKATGNTSSFSATVTKTGTTQEDAKDQMNTVVNKVIADLKSLGIDEKDIKTSNLNVYPNYDNQAVPQTYNTGNVQTGTAIALPIRPGGNKETPTSYTATTTIDVKANSIDLANKAIDTATTDGANVQGGGDFTLDAKAQEELTAKARKLAIDDAKKKAQAIAGEAGITLGRLVNIQVNNNGGIRPMTMMKADSASAGTATDLQPGQNTVQVQVTIFYETR